MQRIMGADIPITTIIQIRFPSSRITVKIVMSGLCDPTTAPGATLPCVMANYSGN
jgi:hypothetical protein